MNLKSVLLLFALIFYIILCSRYYVCDIKNLCPESDSSIHEQSFPLRFFKNSQAYVLGNFDNYSDSIIQLSKFNNIEIVGYYSSDEVNDSEYENLGLARANVLKQLLINRGLDSNKISVFSHSQQLEFTDSLSIATMVDKAVELDLNSEAVQIVTHHGISEVYFPSNSDSEIKSEVLESFLNELVQTSNGKRIKLVGHTDNLGDEGSNQVLSLNRTHTVRDRLIKLGIPEDKIECEGKGSSAPKVNNSTPENRSLNRRVEVIIL